MEKHQLLKKYLDGTSTPEEEQRLFRLLQEDDRDDYRELSRTLWHKIQDHPPTPSGSQEASYQRIVERTSLSPHRYPQQIVWKVAATLTGVLLVTAAIWLGMNPTLEKVITAYGETQTVTLPDGSIVKLNANSALRYATDWETASERAVWLSGEAYFQVTKVKSATGDPVKFTVHAQDLTIQVVGTAFNVHNRSEEVEVVLTEGQVVLQLPQQEQPVVMAPGERVEYRANELTLEKQTVATEPYTAWKDNRYVFDNLSLADIAELIEQSHGFSVHFASDTLAETRMSANIPSTELAVVLEIIEQTLGVNITQSDRAIYISSSNANTNP
ncbi:FecR family protein [Tunicatimonas pelagia]|uniref:FecR family protein n=1 Tax=Tunicatimonas pelagia TaxID=931531 RepID=UPI002666C82C|nr:FecR domain-containing protein [Tunicatimonas pelagia]WKN44975.1 FecR domain-containing protein [Tunicatimonas pelagia]